VLISFVTLSVELVFLLSIGLAIRLVVLVIKLA